MTTESAQAGKEGTAMDAPPWLRRIQENSWEAEIILACLEPFRMGHG